MKKILKILGLILGIIILFLVLAPLLFKGSLEDLLKKNINENLNAQVTWEELDLSLFSSFPNAAVVVKNFSIVNNAPFAGDTLASGERLKIDIGITQLFKSSDEAIKVNALQLDKALINIKVDSLGRANYDIAINKEGETAIDTSEENDSGFSFDLNHYEINNSRINYLDESSQTFLVLTDFNHEGNGDFSLDISELKTKTETVVSFRIGDVAYFKENTLSLDANFQLDLKNQKYTFLENKAKINELPLTFDGFDQINENDSEIDLTFKTPSSDFRNFLAVIPKAYVKNLDGVTTTGNFSVDGMLKGKINDTYIPKMDIKVNSNNASFKYPDLPKAVQNISIDVQLVNETGLIKDTYLNIGGLTFKIDDETFTAKGSIRNLVENAIINMTLQGTLNLANIEQVLPLELDQDLTGIFKVNVTTQFDMRSVEMEQYQNIKTTGTASLSDFTYNDGAFKNEINISEAVIKMSPGNITLKKLNATTGQTDVSARGNIQNLIPWVMAKQDLKGRFNVTSNTFNVNDFMTTEEPSSAVNKNSGSGGNSSQVSDEGVKIPDFLDATLDFSAKKVIYDNIELEDAKGTVKIADETATLENVTSKAFGGGIAFSGNVNTKEATPTFNMNLDLQKIDIDQSFGKLSLLKYIAPIAQALDGDINTTINLAGRLNKDLTPDLKTIVGSAMAQILTAEVNTKNSPLLSKLGEQVKFLNLDKLSLQNISTALDFNNGKIIVKPFDFEVEGIKITAGGSHGLDKNINYNLTMNVPAKYLGGEVNNLLARLNPQEANNMTVALPVALKGSMSNPKVTLNTQSAIKALTQKLIEKQKNDLEEKGLDILKGLIGGDKTSKEGTNSEKNTEKTGITTEEETTKVVKDIFGSLFGKKKKKKDSTGN
ncbi:MAG: AsmA family protein [Flavobacteriaceae bacterium]|nr:AsmA family protein [Flavobacteriaceae bacterium]